MEANNSVHTGKDDINKVPSVCSQYILDHCQWAINCYYVSVWRGLRCYQLLYIHYLCVCFLCRVPDPHSCLTSQTRTRGICVGIAGTPRSSRQLGDIASKSKRSLFLLVWVDHARFVGVPLDSHHSISPDTREGPQGPLWPPDVLWPSHGVHGSGTRDTLHKS